MGQKVIFATLGCDHTLTDRKHGWEPLTNALRDLEKFGPAFYLYGGDHEGVELPTDADGPSFRKCVEAGLRNGTIWDIFGVPSNHVRLAAPGFAALDHFAKWYDPLGKHPETSGMVNSMRRFPVEPGGREDLYRFKVGNINFMMLGDVNRPETPLRSDTTGDPGGVVLPETYERWKREVSEAHDRDEMVFVTSHYGLKDTLTGTGEYDGGKLVNGVYEGRFHAAGRDNGRTSSYLAYIGEKIGRPFIEWMEQNPGKCNFWLNFHQHIYSGMRIGDKGHFEFKAGCQFIQGGFLSRFHGGPGVYPNPKSRLFTLEHGSNIMKVEAYMHLPVSAPGLRSYPRGLRKAKLIEMPRPFELY